MLYVIVGGVFLVIVLGYYIFHRIKRWRIARQNRRDIEAGRIPTSQIGPQPTISGVIDDLNSRMFPRPADSDAYVPYHRRDIQVRSSEPVRREAEFSDPELPSYLESTLPSPLSPVHRASHPRSSASTERLVLPAYSEPPASIEPPTYAPPAPKEPRATRTPLIRTL